MNGLAGAPVDSSGAGHGGRRPVVYLLFAGMGALFVAMVVVAVTSLGGADETSQAAAARQAKLGKLPYYWKVQRGETYSLIAQKTGLTVEELETFNPYVDPAAIVPGQRLKLHKHVPKPKPKLGPKWWTVRTGQSFGLISAKTGKTIYRLRRLNPKLKPESLQPGDRVRLR